MSDDIYPDNPTPNTQPDTEADLYCSRPVIHPPSAHGIILKFKRKSQGKYNMNGDLYDEIPEEIIVNNVLYRIADRDERFYVDLDDEKEKPTAVEIEEVTVFYTYEKILYIGTTCPECGSDDIEPADTNLVEIEFVSAVKTCSCNVCDSQWQENWYVGSIDMIEPDPVKSHHWTS